MLGEEETEKILQTIYLWIQMNLMHSHESQYSIGICGKRRENYLLNRKRKKSCCLLTREALEKKNRNTKAQLSLKVLRQVFEKEKLWNFSRNI